ncbi:MAG: hypothetical protein Q4P29_07015 [Tissierellia bacterium]|nr:hypothetical protein [Tissierellia bacterium]
MCADRIRAAHEQLKYTIRRRMRMAGGLLIEGDGYIVYDMGIEETDGHLVGATLDSDGDAKALVEQMKIFDEGDYEKIVIRVEPNGAENVRATLESANFFCKDEEGSPMMAIYEPIDWDIKHNAYLVSQNQKGEKLLERAMPVLQESFELSEDTARRMLIGGIWTSDENLRAAVIEEEQIKSFGMLTVDPKNKVGGIYYIGTLKSERGKDLGKDIVTVLTNEGFRLGATEIILQASKLGKFVYDRLGYEEIGRYKSFWKEYRAEE